MSCLYTNNIIQCDYSIGGCKEIYLTNRSQISGYSYNSSDVITAVTLNSGALFYEFSSTFDFFDYTDNLSDSANGYSTQINVNFKFAEMEWSKRYKLMQLLDSEVVFFILDSNDNFFVIGEENGLRVNTINSGPGRTGQEFNGYTVNMTGQEESLVKEANSTVYDYVISNTSLDCSQYSATTWSSDVVDFNLIGDCYFYDFT